MTKILLIGDIHGNMTAWNSYHIKHTNPNHLNKVDFSVALGDIGIGFKGVKPQLRSNQYFIRGNHDNPEECKKYTSNYLGDYAIDKTNSILYISGAATLPWDRDHRIEGVSIWNDEELSDKDFCQIQTCMMLFSPKIVISHEGPLSLHKRMFNYPTLYPSRTSIMMDNLLRLHKPDAWYFGHHHQSQVLNFQGIHFQCLAPLEIKVIEI